MSQVTSRPSGVRENGSGPSGFLEDVTGLERFWRFWSQKPQFCSQCKLDLNQSGADFPNSDIIYTDPVLLLRTRTGSLLSLVQSLTQNMIRTEAVKPSLTDGKNRCRTETRLPL